MEAIRIPTPEDKQFEEKPLLPTADYRARLKSVEEKPGYQGTGDPRWMWTFAIEEAGYEDRLIWLWTSQKLGIHPEQGKSRALKTLEALLGGELQPGTVLDWEQQVFGSPCVLSIGPKQLKDGRIVNTINAVLPVVLATGKPFPQGEQLGYLRRFEAARNTLQWTPGRVLDCIYTATKQESPFKSLSADDQAKVLEVMEKAAEEADIPFSDEPLEEDELAAAGMAPMPKSAKHRNA